MRILIVKKKSTFERQGNHLGTLAQGKVDLSLYIDRIRSSHDEHQQSIDKIGHALSNAGLSFDEIELDDLIHTNLGHYSVIVTVGGDGTLLSTSHFITNHHQLLMGVKSAGTSVGHLCGYSADQLDKLVSQLVSNQLPILQVARLQAVIDRAPSKTGGHDPRPGSFVTAPVLNEFLFCHANPAATSRYQIQVGGKQEEHRSSGVWVSTAAGSTAAISAAGGTTMDLSRQDFQFLVREPFMPPGIRFQLLKGFFSPQASPFRIINLCEQAMLAVDGHHSVHEIHYGDVIEFKQATPLALVKPI